MEKILFIRSDRLGEFLLTLPAVKVTKLNYPQAQIYLLARKENIELVRGVDFIDHFWEYQEAQFGGYSGALRLAARLRREKIDCLVSLNPKKEFHLAAFLAGVPLRVGYDRKWGFCLNRKLADEKFLETKHEVEYNIDLVRLVCPEVSLPQIEIPAGTKEELGFLQETLDLGKKYIVIHPFSSNLRKKLEPDFWATLLTRLSHLPQEVVLIGAAEDKNEAHIYEGKWPLKNLVARFSLSDLAAFLKHNCFLFIGLDSGPMHLAAACGAPVVGLFKVSNPKRWGPWGKNILALRLPVGSFAAELDQIVSFAGGIKA